MCLLVAWYFYMICCMYIHISTYKYPAGTGRWNNVEI